MATLFDLPVAVVNVTVAVREPPVFAAADIVTSVATPAAPDEGVTVIPSPSTVAVQA
jgi:hypothetical protein